MRQLPTVLVVVSIICIIFGWTLFPKISLAYNTKTTHPWLTKLSVELYNTNGLHHLNSQEIQWMIKGAVDEDSGLRRINHFYDPINNKTWKLGGTEYLVPALTAKDWSQNFIIQSFYDPIYLSVLASVAKGVIFKKWVPNPIYWSALVSFVGSPAHSRANYTWQKAIYEYIKGNKSLAFQSLGHVLHLIQDMSMPSHTRENVSLAFLGSAVDPFGVYSNRGDPDFYTPIEHSCKNQRFTTEKSLNDYFDNLAKYSNKYFYSADTIGDFHYPFPQVSFPNVREVDKGISKVYILGRDEHKKLFHLARKKLGWRIQSGFNNYTIDDDEVLQDYWSRLAPKAVLSGAGVINLFFQEVEKAKKDPSLLTFNERSKLDILLGDTGALFKKIFKHNPDYVLLNTSSSSFITTSRKNELLSTTTIVPTTKNSMRATTTSRSRETIAITETTTSTTVPSVVTTTTKKETNQTTTTTELISFCDFSTHSFPLRNLVVINEVAWMGSKKGSTKEWIELKNISSKLVNLSGWQLISQKHKIKFIFPNKTEIPSGKFILLERTNDDSVPFVKADFIYSGGLNNDNDGLHLFNNNCQLEDEALANFSWPAGDNTSKRTMERGNDFTWHNYNGRGVNGIYGTPREQNSLPRIVYVAPHNNPSQSSTTTTTTTIPAVTTTLPSTTTTSPPVVTSTIDRLLINEIKVAGKDNEGNLLPHDEFVEIYNPNKKEIDLSGWYLQKKTAHGSSFSSLLNKDSLKGKTINSQGFFLVGHESSTVPLGAKWSAGSLTDNNTIILKNSQGKIIDKVGWGTAQDCGGNCAPSFSAGQSIQRKLEEGEFKDSGNNGSDFAINNCPSPGAISNDCSIEPITQSVNADSLHDFSWHPFVQNSSRIVLDFNTNNYPFISPTKNTSNIFSALVFYLNQNVPGSENFSSSTVYLGGKNKWEAGANQSYLKLAYPNYANANSISSLVLTNNENMAANSSVPRKLSYKLDSLPFNNHFIIYINGANNQQNYKFSKDDYITVGIYGYDKHLTSYLRLIGFDNHHYHFRPDQYYHPPSQIEDFSVSFAEDSLKDNIISSSSSIPNLYFNCSSSSDEDTGDVLKYGIHYVFSQEGDDKNNNDLTRNSWAWSNSQSVPGKITENTEGKLNLEIPLSDLPYIYQYHPYPVEATTTIYWAIRAKDSLGLLSPLSPVSQITIFPPATSSPE